MQETRVQKLTLAHPLTYHREKFGFNELIRIMLSEPAGTDSFIKFKVSYKDAGAVFEYLDSGKKTPLTKEEKDRIESGFSPIIRSTDDTEIPAATYYFEQFPDLSEESLLTITLSGLLSRKSNSDIVYLRLYKENVLELIMQGFRPCT